MKLSHIYRPVARGGVCTPPLSGLQRMFSLGIKDTAITGITVLSKASTQDGEGKLLPCMVTLCVLDCPAEFRTVQEYVPTNSSGVLSMTMKLS